MWKNYYIHHYLVVPPALTSLTLSRQLSLSFIASGKSSELHPVCSQNCCMYVRAGRPAFARSYVGVHRSTSLMSSSLLLQQSPACLVRLTWIVFVMEGRWPYSWCLLACYRQDLFNIARNILATAGKKARRQLHKNAASNIKQALAAPTIRPPASHHENYPS